MILQKILANKLIRQFSKFIIVGGINTGIDFLVLNAEMWLTGIHEGFGMIALNSVSFAIATINSYFMNKRWTFEDKKNNSESVKFSQFIAVSLIGMIINSTVVYFITTAIQPISGISPQLWANGAKLIATGVSLVWNFIGYKLWVFKK
jgi:putative flippase GtrA